MAARACGSCRWSAARGGRSAGAAGDAGGRAVEEQREQRARSALASPRPAPVFGNLRRGGAPSWRRRRAAQRSGQTVFGYLAAGRAGSVTWRGRSRPRARLPPKSRPRVPPPPPEISHVSVSGDRLRKRTRAPRRDVRPSVRPSAAELAVDESFCPAVGRFTSGNRLPCGGAGRGSRLGSAWRGMMVGRGSVGSPWGDLQRLATRWCEVVGLFFLVLVVFLVFFLFVCVVFWVCFFFGDARIGIPLFSFIVKPDGKYLLSSSSPYSIKTTAS